MNRLVRRLAGGIVMTALLASLPVTSSNPAHAQITVRNAGGGYYTPYGQGPYGGYSQGYQQVYNQSYGVPFNQGQVGMFGRRTLGDISYGNTSYPSGYTLGYGSSPYIRSYGPAIYYQPSYRPVYVPLGYGPY